MSLKKNKPFIPGSHVAILIRLQTLMIGVGVASGAWAEPTFFNFYGGGTKYPSSEAICSAYANGIQASHDAVNPGGVTTVVTWPPTSWYPDEKTSQGCHVTWSRNGYTYDYWAFVLSGGCLPGRVKKSTVTNEFFAEPYDCMDVFDVYQQYQDCPTCWQEGPLGNPIYPRTGSKRETVATGFVVGDKELTLTYDSINRPQINLWSTNLHRSLGLRTLSDGSLTATMYRGSEGIKSAVSVTGTNPCGVLPTYVQSVGKVGGNYHYVDPKKNAYETYDASGHLTATYDTKGAVQATTTSDASTPAAIAPAPGYITKVTDESGKSVSFTYVLPPGANASTDALINTIANNQSQTITLGYDSQWRLSTLTWPDSTVRTFVYEDAVNPWALTGVIDENGSRYSTFGYAPSGEAVSTEHAGGVNSYGVKTSVPFQLSYGVREELHGNTLCRYHEIIPPSSIRLLIGKPGTSGAYESDVAISNVAGFPVIAGATQPAGSGCLASSSTSTVDSRGNPTSQDDFNSNRTCYAYDAMNRETTRVEGLSNTVACASVMPTGATLPAGASKTLTQWHADWKLPTVVTAPGSITTTVYHGQPDPFNNNAVANCTPAANLPNGKPLPVVCKTVAQPTLDLGSTSGAPAYDPNYQLDALLLHGDGANGSTTIVDSGYANRTVVARGGTARISTAKSIYGGSSMYFDGAGSYVSFANNADFSNQSGPFTIEAWVNLDAVPTTYSRIAGQANIYGGNQAHSFGFQPNSTKIIGNEYDGSSFATVTSTTSLQLGTWYHVAYVVDANNQYIFVNGVLESQVSRVGRVFVTSTENFSIGRAGSYDGQYFKGYIDDFRYTKGLARYTANFTPPSAPFGGSVLDSTVPVATTSYTYDAAGRVLTTKDSLNRTTSYAYYTDTVFNGQLIAGGQFANTSLQLHGDGANGSTTIVDSSPLHQTVTALGNAKLSTTQSRFGGSSLFFDGVNSQMTTSANGFDFGAGDFTVEGFINVNALPATGAVQAIAGRWEAAKQSWILYLYNNAGTYQLAANYSTTGANSTNLTASFTPVLGTWYHVAVSRSGSTLRLFVNGTQIASAAMTATVFSTPVSSPTRIGAFIDGNGVLTGFFNGHMDELRITKGVGLYTASFTPPSAPFADPAVVTDPNAVGHTLGDLQSITDPKGFVTTFNAYDRSGRVLQMTDPKGVVTTMTYTPRGWISTVSVTPPAGAARVTTYTYDAVGQLTGVANPDGSTISYSYDAAHRLVGATDAKGNTVSYTLDNMGNRLAEQLKDPSGALQRTMSRSFDALNRVQQLQLH